MLSVRLTEQAEVTLSLFSEQRYCIVTSPQRKVDPHSRNEHKKSPYHIGKGIIAPIMSYFLGVTSAVNVTLSAPSSYFSFGNLTVDLYGSPNVLSKSNLSKS